MRPEIRSAPAQREAPPKRGSEQLIDKGAGPPEITAYTAASTLT